MHDATNNPVCKQSSDGEMETFPLKPSALDRTSLIDGKTSPRKRRLLQQASSVDLSNFWTTIPTSFGIQKVKNAY